jgi:hypothetical protein
MQEVQDMRAWRNFTLILMLVLAVVGVWAVSTVFASKPATVGAAATSEEATLISPMEMMLVRGRHVPIGDYAEPF